jgi:hypothetical protein
MKRLAFFLISLSTVLLKGPVAYSAEVTQDIDASFQQTTVNSPESKFEEYGEKPSGVTVDDYYLKSIGEKVNIDVEIRDLRLDQQAADVKLQGAKTTLKGSWDQVPHLYSNEARTLYVNQGGGVLRLPDQLQTSIQNTPYTSTNSAVFVPIMASYLTGAQPIELKTRTDTGKVDLSHEFSDQWRSSLSFSQQKKHGTRAKSATFGFNNDIEVALPVDEDTYNSNLGVNYLGKKVQAGLLYNLSTYENHIDNLVWDNPKRITDRYTSSSGYSNGDQSSQGRMSLSPDNIAHNVLLTFGLNLPYKSRMTANVGYNNHAQNETLLPYTINTAINTTTALTGTSKPPFNASDPANRPADKAEAKIITWTQNYDLTTDWSKKVRSKLKFDSIQINNKTPELSMPGEANIDQVWVVGTVENHAYESRRDNIEGQVDYAVCSAFKANASFGEAKTKRMHRDCSWFPVARPAA